MFLHVVSPSVVFGSTPEDPQHIQPEGKREEQVLADAANYLAEVIAAHQEDLAGVPPEMDVAFGFPSPTLSQAARLEQGDLIVMCSHREAGLGPWGMESTTQQTLHRSPVPLLILHEHGTMPLPDATHPLRIIVPLDGSLFAEAALEPALHLLFHLVGSAPGELRLTQVVKEGGTAYAEAERYLKAITARLRKGMATGHDVLLTSTVAVGANVARTLFEQIEEASHAPLIVMATHSRDQMQRLLLGSVAEELLEATTCPLLILCPRLAGSRTAQPGQRAVGKL